MRRALFLAAFAACASQNNIHIVKNFRAATERGDFVAAQTFVAPGARLWFEQKKGVGEPYIAGGGSWEHWDHYFHSKTVLSDWRVDSSSVTATVHETNDFMRLLDWHGPPYTMTWWFNADRRISEVLIKSGGRNVSRLDEFTAWAKRFHPRELQHLMPKGEIDPSGDRPERWRAILEEWRYGTKR